MRTITIVGLTSLALAASAPAFAAVTESNFVDLIGFGDEQTVRGTSFTSLLGSSATVGAGPTVSAYAVTTNDYYKSSVQQRLSYQFTINVAGLPAIAAGHDRASVPLIITYAGGVSANGPGSGASISLSVENDIIGGLFDDTLGCGVGRACTSISRSAAFDFGYSYDGGGGPITTDTGTVKMVAYAVGQAGDTAPYGGYSAYAWLDPTISFSPEFLAEHPDATISVDAVATPTPEPGEWAMMTAGLGIVGGIARKRRRRA